MISLCSSYSLNDLTLHLSVAILDKFLFLWTMKMTRKRLQCAGIASVYIASKVEEEFSPSLQELTWICDNAYTEKEIIDMESEILSTLKYDVMIDTLRNYVSTADYPSDIIFSLDCILLNTDILYGYDNDEIIESCVEAYTKSGTYWSRCIDDILKYKKSIKSKQYKEFPELKKKFKI